MISSIPRGIAWFIILMSATTQLYGASTAERGAGERAPVDYENVKRRISGLIKKEMKKHDVVGMSIAIVDDQRVVWAEGFGYEDKERNVPASADTLYRTGSISKLFTVTAALRLAELGRMDIDKPLKKYLPQFSVKTRFPDAGPVTPRNIMSHHSGLPSDLSKGMWTANPEPFTKVVDRIHETYAAYPPNFIFSYSNLAMTLLGHAVENASGRDFASYLEESVLLPLGMTHSSFSTSFTGKGYRNGRASREAPLRDIPAGGLNSSVSDLSHFISMIFAGGKSGGRRILRAESVHEMFRPQNADVPLDLNFRVGLGWMLSGLGKIDIRNAGTVAHHAGGTVLFHSQIIILPEKKLGVVVLANSSGARSAVSDVAAEALAMALETRTGIKQPEPVLPDEDKDAIPKPELDAYAGRYATMIGSATVYRKGSSLRVEALDRSFRLVPRVDGRLRMKYRFLGFIPISLGELDYIGISRAVVAGYEVLTARWGTQDLLVGEKIRPVSVPDSWIRRTGDYDIVNRGDDISLAEDIRLRLDDGQLIIKYAMPVFFESTLSVALIPLSDTEAVSAGLGRGMGETIRVVIAGGEEYLEYSGYLLKKKRY